MAFMVPPNRGAPGELRAAPLTYMLAYPLRCFGLDLCIGQEEFKGRSAVVSQGR